MLGAGVGGGLRFVLGSLILARTGPGFPWHTLVVNLLGAFALGLLVGLNAEYRLVSEPVHIMLAVGVLGGFTTFSTLSYESIDLIQKGMVVQGLVNVFGSSVAGLAAVALGMLAGRAA